MANISLGAEVYTWFMRETGKAYDNKLGHMIEMVEKAGFEGIEPMHIEEAMRHNGEALKGAYRKIMKQACVVS